MTERKRSIYQMVSWTTAKVKCFRGLPKHISLHHTLPADLIAQTLTGTIVYPEIQNTVMMCACTRVLPLIFEKSVQELLLTRTSE